MKEKMLIIAPVQSRSGYGVHSRAIAQSILTDSDLMKRFDVQIMPLRWGNTPLTGLDVSNQNHLAIFKALMTTDRIDYQPDVSIHITVPNEFQRVGKFSIGVTAGTEASIAPVEFINGCNLMDLVITPSEFTKSVLINSIYDKKDQTGRVVHSIQIDKPIEVLFEGYDDEIYDKKLNTKSLDKFNFGKFALLSVGTWLNGTLYNDRKNISGLIKAFFEAFMHKKEKPSLVLKVNGAGYSIQEKEVIINKITEIEDLVRSNHNFKGRMPKIYLINGELTDREMNDLYNHPDIKAMISFTNAEGYGLPLLEFSTTGKPILVSNYSGHLDFINSDYSVLLPGTLVNIDSSAANEFLPSIGTWYRVNEQFAKKIMVDLYENYDRYHEKSRKSAKFVKDRFTLSLMQSNLNKLLEKYVLTSTKPTEISLKLPKLRRIE